MRIVSVLLASVAAVAVASPACAEEERKPDVAAELPADQVRPDEIIVVGKSYGQEVGKTVTPLKDVPNTITVIDREQLEAQNLLSLEDALTAANGITVTGVGSEDPSFMSRGFAINNYLVDGVSTLAFNFPSVVPDLFFYERLEVLRGPAGLFSGSGNPAGSINLVRKRPLDGFRAQASAGAGSWNNFRGEIDVSAPLSSSVGVRGGVMVQDQDQFFDVAHRFRLAGYGTLAVEIDPATTLTIGGNYDRYEPAIQSGLPGYAGGPDGSEGRLLDIDRSTYLGADWNRFRSDTWTAFGDLTHRISDRWTLRFSGLYSDVERIDVYSYIGSQAVTDASNTTPTGVRNNGVTNHIAYRGESFSKTTAFDFNGIGSFSAFGRDQTLILGADYQAQDYDSYYTRLSNYARINVFDPVSPAEPPLDTYGPSPYYPVQGSGATCPATSTPIVPAPANCVLQSYGGTSTVVEQYGLYGQLRLSPVAGVTITGGGRLTWWESNNQVLLPTRGNRTSQQIDGRFTPYAGIVWDATDNLNFYVSYADSFSPQAAPAGRRKPDGSDVLPLIGAQFEGGTKLSLMNDKLLVSLAAYQIEQTNRLFNDPDDATIYLQVGKVRARGIEAEIGGEIVPGWRINGGYSYTKTKYLEDANTAFEGIPLTPIIPEHMVKLLTNYAPVDGALRGLSLGGGVTWFDGTYGGNPSYINPVNNTRVISTIVRQGAYAVVDLRAGYKINDQISLSINANNVLDRNYYARISATGRGNYYGQPRSVFGTIRFTFE